MKQDSDLGRVRTSNFSLQSLARQRNICWCEFKHVTKSHWQISKAKMKAVLDLANTLDKVS